MRVAQLWRFPVKSMQGERLEQASIGDRGIEGDRQWAIVDTATGLALTAKREPALLMAVARIVDGNGSADVEVTLPDGTMLTDDAALSAWLGRSVTLRHAVHDARATYEIAADFEDEANSEVLSWNGPKGSFHDSNRTLVSIASLASVGEWDVRRFRMNVIVDLDDEERAGGEEALIGHRIRLGGAVLDVVKGVDRCVMTTRPQPGGIERDLDVLRRINRERAGSLGVGAMVIDGGVVRSSDELTILAD